MRRIGPAAALVALLALTACGDEGDPAVSGTPTASATSAPATASAVPTASPDGAAATPAWPAACPSPSAAPAGATVITATVAGGNVSSDKRTYDVKLDSAVRLVVTADVADEVHVHGYDVHADTTPGCPAVIDLEARIPGEVEVELEGAHRHLFSLRAR